MKSRTRFGWMVTLASMLCLAMLVVGVNVYVVAMPAGVSPAHAPTQQPLTEPSWRVGLPDGDDWNQYRFDLSGTAVNPEQHINSSNVAGLQPAWVHDNKPGPYESTPAIVDGIIYMPSGNELSAYDLITGAKLWTFIGVKPSFGPTNSSVAVDAAHHLAYYGSANANVYAVDTRTGKGVWRTRLGDPNQGAHIWSSPLLVHGNIYIGLASYQDKPCVRGAVVALNAQSGAIRWTHYTAPEDETGGGVWSSVTVDVDDHAILATTGNPCKTLDGQYVFYPGYEQDSIVALNWDTGDTVWSYKALELDDCDCDFGQGPVSFTLGGQKYIVAGNKNGIMYGLVRTATGVRLAWSTQIAKNDYIYIGGIFQPPAYKDGMIYVSGGTLQDDSCQGAVWALHGDTGAVAWKTCTSRRVISPGAITGDVLFTAHNGEFDAYSLKTGAILWHAVMPGEVWGGTAISHGYVVVGSAAGKLYCFTLGDED